MKIHPNNSKCDWTLKMQYSIKLKGSFLIAPINEETYSKNIIDFCLQHRTHNAEVLVQFSSFDWMLEISVLIGSENHFFIGWEIFSHSPPHVPVSTLNI